MTSPMTTDTPAAAPITMREAPWTLAEVSFEAGIARGQGAKNDWSTDGKALAIIEALLADIRAALSAPVAAPVPSALAIQPWPPGASMLQVAVAPNAAAGPYPTAMRPATAEEVAAMQQRFAAPVAAQPAASGVDALWVDKAMELADDFAEVFAAYKKNPSISTNITAGNARAALRAHLSTALTGAAKEAK
jgi:hypothetical protein